MIFVDLRRAGSAAPPLGGACLAWPCGHRPARRLVWACMRVACRFWACLRAGCLVCRLHGCRLHVHCDFLQVQRYLHVVTGHVSCVWHPVFVPAHVVLQGSGACVHLVLRPCGRWPVPRGQAGCFFGGWRRVHACAFMCAFSCAPLRARSGPCCLLAARAVAAHGLGPAERWSPPSREGLVCLA